MELKGWRAAGAGHDSPHKARTYLFYCRVAEYIETQLHQVPHRVTCTRADHLPPAAFVEDREVIIALSAAGCAGGRSIAISPAAARTKYFLREVF